MNAIDRHLAEVYARILEARDPRYKWTVHPADEKPTKPRKPDA